MLGSILEALPFLLQSAPKINQGFKGVDLKRQKRAAAQMNNLAGQQAQLAGAQTNMNSPLFQSLYGQERAAGQADLADTIAEISRQNRKLTSMGRNPLLDRERGGESIFRNLMKGQQDVGNTARRNTFDQLRLGQNSLAGAQSSYGNIYDAYGGLSKQQFQNDQGRVGAYHNIGTVLQQLFGLNNGNSTQYQNGEMINWNQ